MKKFLGAIALCLSILPVWANTTCNMIVPFPAGGSSDLYGRIMQRQNPDIVMTFKPGAFASQAIAVTRSSKDAFILGIPNMYSADNPDKNPPVELLNILFFIDAMIVTNKNIAVTDLLSKNINMGIPGIGQAQHTIALKLKQRNSNMEIIAFGGDVKALPSLINKEIDAYVVSGPLGRQWLNQYPTLKVLAEISYNRPFKLGDITLENLNFVGIFVNKDATPEQKQQAVDCVNRASSKPEYFQEFSRIGITATTIVGREKDQALKRYIEILREVGQ